MQAHTTLTADTSTYNASMAKTEISRSGIIELYPPVGQLAVAAAEERWTEAVRVEAEMRSVSRDG